ncbi:integrin alpha-6-like isoform X1 [Micropterus dolomieu]|uniref:integrin alpha-6-like isoform X1 n=2 Tax=Micropterus dolomieu TaxID=147949 RepID=UPI001E8DD07E|nr:integrin alpha-6-like isoform X1 [Micropterus dolomieu]
MEGRITCGLWTVVFLLGCGRLSAFNLDTDNVLRRSGDPGSLFGFSLAMHRQLVPADKRLLLVGAPKAKALSRQKAKVTGGLYSCDMSSTSAGCTRVNFDNNEDTSRESKENQWMGVSVNSQGPGGMVVTCAHRYQRRTSVNTAIESRDIIGRCYVLNPDLSIDPGLSDNWHFCESRSRGHEMFGSCQQGLSATFDKEYHYVIFGAPGAYNWKGVVRMEQRNDTLLELGVYDDGPFEVGDENDKNPDLVPAPANSYLGFSLDSGKSLTKKGQLTVVAGAPRANHSGAVVLLKKGENSRNILVDEYTLEGEGLASSFGYDLTVLDLNGDGWQDIVVGAPQYFEKDKEIGGAVYVYVNKAGKWNQVTPIRIDGSENSMFGLAVENLGDINQDGYHDFAVGAPYEDDSAGNVYIYHGSDKELRYNKAAQVLSGKPLGVRLFGYSLAGNMDLDKNFYPDLAVGSLSDSVFVFKARPVIKINKEITFSPSEIDLTKKNCGNSFCLDVEACFSYTANPKSYSPRLTVAYSLQADTDQRKNGLNSRATFLETPDPSYESKGVITIDGKGTKQCVKRQLTIQDNIQDKLRGIPIDLSVDIQDAKRKRRQSSPSQLLPVLDAAEPMITRSMVNFLKEGCGSDNVCQSNLQVKYRYGHRSTDDKFTALEIKEKVPVISLSDQKDITLEVKVDNLNGDDAYEAAVVVSLPPSLTYSTYRIPPNERQVTCTANKDGSQANCELGNPFKRDSETTFYIILSTSRISLNTTELEIDLQLKTTSNQQKTPVKAKAKVAIQLQLSISGQAQPSQVYFAGETKDEEAIEESEIGTAITHQFRIINLGKRLTNFGTATLEIEWPKETDKGKGLLYLMKISSTGVENIECSPKDQINPHNKKPSNTRRRRAAENTQGGVQGTISRLIEREKSKTLSCDNGANCVSIRCPLRGLDSNAVITLHSRLWNATFIKDFPNLHHVEVTVTATLHVDSTITKTVLQNGKTQVRLTVFPERREAHYGGVPWWIIVLSILLGLLLLGLLAFLLWKCGFFERAKYEDKVPSYNAIRIKRDERVVNPGNGNWENMEKKPWMTTWHDKEHYS